MDRIPGVGLRDSISHYDFSADEIEVATTLTRLNFLILYDSLNLGFLPPLWGSKRLRSACAPDRQTTESVATSGGGAQGSPGIVVEIPREKEEKKERRNFKIERTESEEHPAQVDFSRTIRSQSDGQLTVSQLTTEPSSATDPQPNGGAHASPGSPLLFDLNLTPPDFSGMLHWASRK